MKTQITPGSCWTQDTTIIYPSTRVLEKTKGLALKGKPRLHTSQNRLSPWINNAQRTTLTLGMTALQISPVGVPTPDLKPGHWILYILLTAPFVLVWGTVYAQVLHWDTPTKHTSSNSLQLCLFTPLCSCVFT